MHHVILSIARDVREMSANIGTRPVTCWLRVYSLNVTWLCQTGCRSQQRQQLAEEHPWTALWQSGFMLRDDRCLGFNSFFFFSPTAAVTKALSNAFSVCERWCVCVCIRMPLWILYSCLCKSPIKTSDGKIKWYYHALCFPPRSFHQNNNLLIRFGRR